ncbi:MAG: carbohydrate ABC transporter permease [Planctomycetota bacterium]
MSRAGRGLVLAGAAVFALAPVYWILLTAFRPREEIFRHPPALVPTRITLEPVRHVWLGSATNEPILPFLGSSLLVSTAATVLATAVGVLAAYALGRSGASTGRLSFWILSQRFLPPVALIVPLFVLFRDLGLFDTHAGLVFLYAGFNIPMAVWLLIGFVEGLPAEAEEAALLDGASPRQVFWHVALPLLRPGLAVTAIFTFLFSWNEYLCAYQLTADRAATVPVYLPRLRSAVAELYGEIAAAALFSVLPALVFAGVLERHLARGLTLGGERER